MSAYPSGTVTFLFTDIEGSTELLKQLGEGYADLLKDQRRILRGTFRRWDGQEVDTQGDAFFYAFPRATAALKAAAEVQRELHYHAWPESVTVRVRMGLHTGEPLDVSDEGYIGMDVHRAARIAHAGHGGQILLSETTAPLILDQIPEDSHLVELGRHRLKDMRRPERIAMLALDDLRQDFPPLKSLEALPPDTPLDYGSIELPDFLETDKPAGRPTFVGRDAELERLEHSTGRVLEGHGQVVLISGGPGRGKTALLDHFCHAIGRSHPEMFICWGECSAYSGQGDPYLPFRQVLRGLTGDIKSLWVAGRLPFENAACAWKALPISARAVVENGPALIGRIIPGGELLGRARAALPESAPWVERLASLAEDDQAFTAELEQVALFEQYEDVLTRLAADLPILMVLDDLQWIDSASAALFFHLSRRLAGRRILILGAYRPEELAYGRGDDHHPLRFMLTELKRTFGDLELDLGRIPDARNQAFVQAYLDSEPNQLGNEFREALFQHTKGHPLFLVELLRSMQERGDLVRDEEGRWIQGGEVDWETLPARIEGVIEERLGRLEPELHEILRVASVEGEAFTAQVLQELLGTDDRALYRALGQQLGREHRLVREQGLLELPGRRLSRFAFRHALFQGHVYLSLSAPEKSRYHAEVGAALEALYGDERGQIASQLARHFQLGGIPDKAVEYAIMAGDRARLVHAFAEAAGFYEQALGLLEGSGKAELTARTLLKLGLIWNAQGEHERANRINEQAFELWEPLRAQWIAGSENRYRKMLRLAAVEPRTLDPGLISEDASAFWAAQLFEGLVTVDEENNVLPAAASRWEILDGGQRYRFYLREGMRWSDGSPLRADDFVYAWRRNLRMAARSPVAHLLFVIENAGNFAQGELQAEDDLGVRALHENVLEVALETPIAYLPHLLTHPVAYPLQEGVQETPQETWFGLPVKVTNGPYTLTASDPGERLVLERNPYYRGAGSGNIQSIQCSLIREYATAFDRFDREELDLVSMITSDPKAVRQARRRFGSRLKFIPHPATFFVSFCCVRPPFDQALVRQAFVHAIDREALIRETSQGQYQPALGGFLPSGFPGHQPGIGLAHNPERAQELLVQAGFPGGKDFPTVDFLFTGPDPHDPLIDFLCQAWERELNVNVEAENTNWETFVERRDTNPPHLSTMGYTADYPDPDAVLRVLFHSQQGFNPSRCQCSELDELVER
ncbi:MAG: ABC transporter substrate-binding protein, partial [Anaerolineales bacterium]